MPPQNSQPGRGMRLFSDMPLETANWLSDVANLVLLGSLIAGVLATFVVVQAGNVKEAHWDKAREEAVKAIAEANARAEEAKAVAEGERLARIKLEKEMAWRSLSGEQTASLVSAMHAFAGQLFTIATYPDDPEAVNFASDLVNTLVAAGWRFDKPKGPLAFGVETGLRIEIAPSKLERFGPITTALSSGLNEIGIRANATVRGALETENPNAITIRIGKKPERAAR